jgi:hypothetical protein
MSARSRPATTPAWRAASDYLGAHVARHDGVRGDVAGAAEILEQCCADDRFDED